MLLVQLVLYKHQDLEKRQEPEKGLQDKMDLALDLSSRRKLVRELRRLEMMG